MRYKPYLSVTHTLTNSISRLLFFMNLNAVYLAVIAALRGQTAASGGTPVPRTPFSISFVFFLRASVTYLFN